MENFRLTIVEENGEVRILNFDEVKTRLLSELSRFGDMIYMADSESAARQDRNFLNQLKRYFERMKGRIRFCGKERGEKNAEASEQIDALITTLDHPIALVHEYLEFCAEEKARRRRRELLGYARKNSSSLGTLSEIVISSPEFWEERWDSQSVSSKLCREEIKKKLDCAASVINSLKDDADAPALIMRYLENFRVDGLAEYRKKLRFISGAKVETRPEDNVVGYKVVKIEGRSGDIDRMIDDMRLLGAKVTLVKDGTPPRPAEHREADFGSFVAFDLETTGSLGVYSGDGRPEITEIGAVRVRNGEITERFSELCNPGRPITPTVVELTGITDEMVADKPTVSEALKRFIAFIGDDILLGHGIKDSDMIFLERAARRDGVALENQYFDTFRFAKRLGGEPGFEGLGLEALAKHFGISQENAHRALDDAEVTAKLYEKLRKL